MSQSLKTLFSPLSPEAFSQDIFGKKSFHMKADSTPLRQHFFSWKDLNTILNLSSVWSQNSLQLVQNGLPIAAQRYCVSSINRDKQAALVPDGKKVQQLIEKGADLFCRDIDDLHPSLKHLAAQLENLLHSKIQIDLHASWKPQNHSQPQFLYHDALILQMAGDRPVHLYEEKSPNPVHHPAVNQELQKYSQTIKGKASQEITLDPGAWIFVPRGQYHEIKPGTAPSLSLVFLMARPVYLELVALLFEHMIMMPQARETLKLEGDTSQQADYFGQILTQTATSAEFKTTLEYFKSQFQRPRSSYEEENATTEKTDVISQAS